MAFCRAPCLPQGSDSLLRWLLIGLCLFCLAAPADLQAQDQADPRLERAISAYHNGGFHEASAQLNALLYPLKLEEMDQILEARIYLGLCAYILERPEEAAAEFSRVLEVDPRYQLDPLYTPPDILAFFEQLRKKRLQARPTPSSVPTAPPAIISRTAPQDFILDLAPLGIAQFRAQRPIHGALLLAGEMLLGTVATVTYLYHRDYIYQDPPESYDEQAAMLLRVKRVNQVTFWSTTALITYGAADALYRVGQKTAPITLRPMGTPGGVALSISGRF